MMSKYKQFPDRNIEDLLNAVVVRAAEDYREAYVTLMKRDSSRARTVLQETESFFHSEDFSCFTLADGPRIFSMLKREREEVETGIRELRHLRKELVKTWAIFEKTGRQDAELYEKCRVWANRIKTIILDLPQFTGKLKRLKPGESRILKEIIRMRGESEHDSERIS